MGFDIECIIDIHNYPGEYFCPVCRTLVYPNEAFQSQCTHLYCKPCLAHVTNGTKACPYDGYLVTESDSKPLIDSDKALAENIGKVKVHCLYFRSGCAWSGTLSDITSHCSECSFGNSPVICNRCGIQIVHRQVHDHAQSCPGAYEGQQATGGVSAVTRSSTAPSASTTEVNQVVAQPGGPPPQAQNTQNFAATLVPGQNPNLQVNAHSQAPVAATVAVPTPEQWYQQQYQQYYQQYAGYDPYQQTSQQYYSLQQPPFQQYQQHQTQVQGQPQSHVYPQLQPQVQTHPPQPQTQQQLQSQPQPQPQPQQQPQSQPQPQVQIHQHPNTVSQTPNHSQLQPQAQGQQQPQLLQQGQQQPQLLQQGQPHGQFPPQGQAQAQAPAQALMPNYQAPQQQTHSSMRPQTQVPLQTLPPPPPHSQSTHPPLSTQAMGMRPFVQHPQVPQYQQPHVQMHHPQVPQTHVQPQPQPHAQSSNQLHVQIQPQAQYYNTQAQPPNFPSQANYSAAPAALPQAPHPPPAHPPVPPISGHHSYQQPQPALKMHSGGLQQHLVHPHPASGSLYPPVHGQVPQQPGVMRPPLSHSSSSQQQPSTLLPLQNQVTGIPPFQHQQIPPHAQQPTHPTQQRAVLQPVQQVPSQYYAQQQHFAAPFPNQRQQGQLSHPQAIQPQMRPSGPPQPPQSQNYAGRPFIPNQGMHSQSHPFSTGGFVSQAHSGSAQLASAQTSINQNYKTSSVVAQNKTDQETRSPSKGLVEKGFDDNSVKEVVVKGLNETVVNDGDSDAKDGLKPVIKQEEDVQGAALEQASGGKPFGGRGVQGDLFQEEGHSLADPSPLKQEDLKTAGAGPSSGNMDLQSQTSVSASSTEERVSALQSHGSHQQRPQAKGQGQPPSVLGPEGPGILPHAGQSLNPTEGRVPGYFAPSLKSFESESGPQGHALTTLAEPRGVVGRATPLRFEGHYGPQHVDRPSEVPMSKDPMPGSGDGGPPMRTHADEPSFLRMNGGTAPDSSVFGRWDEKPKTLSREHLNPFPGEPTHIPGQASTVLHKASHGPIYDSGLKLDPGAMGPQSRSFPHRPPGGHADMFGPGSEHGQHHMKHFGHRSPDREYSSPHGFRGPSNFSRSNSAFDDINSREAHRFSEGSRSTNVSSGPVGNPFRDGRFTSFSEHPRRGDNGDLGNHRFGDHMAPGPIHNQVGSHDVFRADGPGRGKFSGPGYLQDQSHMDETAGSGVFPGHGRGGELGDPGSYPRLSFAESARGDRSSFPQFGDPTMRNYSLPGYPNSGNFAGGMDSFDHSRKRKPVSTGWCRICSLDCESVEGLDMHSQTREHQQMAMDMVKSIKLQNRKMQRAAGMVHHEGGSRTRRAGAVGRGSKP